MQNQFGKYLLLDKLGEGGMSEVFLAQILGPEGFTKLVALKLMLPHLNHDEVFTRSFINEARLGGFLNHHNIVQTLEFGQHDDQYYLAMEYVRGVTLRAALKAQAARGVPFPIDISLRICIQIAEGLSYAHLAEDADGRPLKMVHRDLKPSNILINAHGVSKISDFGVARAESNMFQTVAVGDVKGTVSYMSPEQAMGERDLDSRSDLYSLGAIIFELTTGERLYPQDNYLATLRQVQDGKIDRRIEQTLSTDFGHRLLPVLQRSLAFRRDIRYGTAQEIARELRDILQLVQYSQEVQDYLKALLPNSPLATRGTTSTFSVSLPASVRERLKANFPGAAGSHPSGNFPHVSGGVSSNPTPSRPSSDLSHASGRYDAVRSGPSGAHTPLPHSSHPSHLSEAQSASSVLEDVSHLLEQPATTWDQSRTLPSSLAELSFTVAAPPSPPPLPPYRGGTAGFPPTPADSPSSPYRGISQPTPGTARQAYGNQNDTVAGPYPSHIVQNETPLPPPPPMPRPPLNTSMIEVNPLGKSSTYRAPTGDSAAGSLGAAQAASPVSPRMTPAHPGQAAADLAHARASHSKASSPQDQAATKMADLEIGEAENSSDENVTSKNRTTLLVLYICFFVIAGAGAYWMLQPKILEVAVTSYPLGALLSSPDGVSLGKTPVRVKVPSNGLTITASLDGHKSVTQTISPGHKGQVLFDLLPINPAPTTKEAPPSGAMPADGASAGKPGPTAFFPPPVVNKTPAKAEDATPAGAPEPSRSREHRKTTGSRGGKHVTPPAHPGYLTLSADPYAFVEIDGRSLKTTPLMSHVLTPGAHSVRLTTEDGQERRFTVEIESGVHHKKVIHFDETP